MAVYPGCREGIGKYLPANYIKDNVNSLAIRQPENCLDEILFSIVDTIIGTACFGKRSLLWAADSSENRRPELLGNLNGDIPYSSSAAMIGASPAPMLTP